VDILRPGFYFGGENGWEADGEFVNGVKFGFAFGTEKMRCEIKFTLPPNDSTDPYFHPFHPGPIVMPPPSGIFNVPGDFPGINTNGPDPGVPPFLNPPNYGPPAFPWPPLGPGTPPIYTPTDPNKILS
jgi:hypothetical protein